MITNHYKSLISCTIIDAQLTSHLHTYLCLIIFTKYYLVNQLRLNKNVRLRQRFQMFLTHGTQILTYI